MAIPIFPAAFFTFFRAGVVTFAAKFCFPFSPCFFPCLYHFDAQHSRGFCYYFVLFPFGPGTGWKHVKGGTTPLVGDSSAFSSLTYVLGF